MKKLLILLMSLSMALLLISCSPKTNDTENQTNAPSDKDDETIMFNNIVSDETKNELKKTLLDKNLDEDDVNFFINSVDEYNKAADKNELKSDYTKYSEDITYNKSIDKYIEKNPDFIGINCRITTFSLVKNSLKVEKELDDKSSVLDFDKKAISDKSILSSDELNKFIAYFAPINVSDADGKYEDLITNEFVKRGIKFNNDNVKLVSVYINSNDEIDGNIFFVGHTGLMYKGNNDYYFIEKLSFQEPYQMLKFKNKKALYDYLINKYNIKLDENSHDAIITENDKLFEF